MYQSIQSSPVEEVLFEEDQKDESTLSIEISPSGGIKTDIEDPTLTEIGALILILSVAFYWARKKYKDSTIL